MLNGGCYCGWIRYEAAGTPFDQTICHCSICRRTTGAPMVAWFSLRKSEYKVSSGHPALFNSTPQGVRSFCPRCGTQLTFEHESLPDEIDITTSSLDEPERVPPADHTRTSSKLAWIHLGDGLPQHREQRP
jgi:hypothetical protein